MHIMIDASRSSFCVVAMSILVAVSLVSPAQGQPAVDGQAEETQPSSETSSEEPNAGETEKPGEEQPIEEAAAAIVPPPPEQDVSDLAARLRDTEERLDRIENASDRQRVFWSWQLSNIGRWLSLPWAESRRCARCDGPTCGS